METQGRETQHANYNDNNFVQLNKYYDLYNNIDRRWIENVIVRNMILKHKGLIV